MRTVQIYTYPSQPQTQKTNSECYTKLNILGDVSTFLFNTSVYTNDYSSTHLQKSYITKDLDDKAST